MASWIERAAKTVTSKVDDAFDRGFEVGRGAVKGVKAIGDGIADLAEAPFADDEYDGFFGTLYEIAVKRGGEALGAIAGPDEGLGALIGGIPGAVRNPAGTVIGGALDAAETVYREGISEPISTLMTMGSLASQPEDGFWGDWSTFLDADSWRSAYKIAQDRSPGQAIAFAIGTRDITDPKEVERFAGTDSFRQWSGTADAILRWKADPTVLAGNAVKKGRNARRAIPTTQEGIRAAREGGRVNRFVNRVDEIVEQYGDPKVAAGRIRAELFPDHHEGAYLSDLLAKAPDTATRRRIVGAGMGSAEDIAALTKDAPALASQLTKLSDEAWTVYQREKGMYGPGRLELVEQEIEALYPLADDFTKLDAIAGSLQEIPGASVSSQLRAGITTSDFYQAGAMAAPVRVVTNMLPQRWLNLNDTRSDVHVSRMLDQAATYVPTEERFALRTSYMGAVDAPARQRAALDIEARVVQGVLDKYGVPQWIVNDVLENAPRLRESAMGALRRRQYDAEGRGSVLVAGADGSYTRMHLPLHVTQQADLLPMVDIAQLEKAAQAVAGWDWNSGVFSSIRNRYQGLRTGASGTKRAQAAAAATATPGAVLDVFYDLWRPATLLRAGWPARILADEQLRILAKIGAMTHVSTLGRGAKREVRQRLTPWSFYDENGELIQGRGLPSAAKATAEQLEQGIVKRGMGEWETSVKLRTGEEVTLPPAFGTPGDAEQVFRRLNSANARFKEAVVPTEDMLLGQLRQHTGRWTSIAPDSGDYPAAWEGAVNRQIRNSAFAREALAGKSADEMVEWLAKTDEGRAYARQMGWSVRSYAAHAEDVLDQVRRYLPVPQLRQELLKRELKHSDLAKLRPDPKTRFAVHGEELAQALGDSMLRTAARKTVDQAWKFLGQLPTDVLSRNPFFDAMYRMEAERVLNLMADGAREAGRALTADDIAAAASKGRRFALNESQKLLYDLGEKSHFAHILRFVAPFYMAWQEVGTRWAGLAVENPAFAARMRQVWNAPEKAGLITDENGFRVDENGHAYDPITDERVPDELVGAERYVTLPVRIPGLPTGGPVRFNKKGANLALSGLPGVGPPVQVPVNEIVKSKPDLETSLRIILPYGPQQSIRDIVFPAVWRRAFALQEQDEDRVYANTLLRIYFDRYTDFKRGLRPEPPDYGEVKKATQDLYALRTFASFVSPVAPIFDSPYQPYISAYRNAQERMRQEEAPFGRHENGDPISVDEWFLDTHGEEYFWLTQSLSRSMDGVAPTVEGYQARKRYQDLVEKHPELGSVILGREADGEFSGTVYQNQLSSELRPGAGINQRGGYTFEEGAEQPEIRLGWIRYGQVMDAIEVERVNRGLPNLDVRAANDLAVLKKVTTDALKRKYPAWAEEFSIQDNEKYAKRLDAFREIVNDKRLKNRADRPDIAGLRAYLQLRDYFVEQLDGRKAKTLTASSNQDLAALWSTARAKVVEKYPAFADVFYRYLERDPLSGSDNDV